MTIFSIGKMFFFTYHYTLFHRLCPIKRLASFGILTMRSALCAERCGLQSFRRILKEKCRRSRYSSDSPPGIQASVACRACANDSVQHKYLGCAVCIVLTMLNPFIKSENCFCVRSVTSCLSRGHWNTPFCKRLESRTKPSPSQTRPLSRRLELPENRNRISVS